MKYLFAHWVNLKKDIINMNSGQICPRNFPRNFSGISSDDPEGIKALEEIKEKAKQDKDTHILLLPQNDIEINALQRASIVII